MSAAATQSGDFHLTKDCSEFNGTAGSFCTVTSASLDSIPAGSKVVYAEAMTPAGGLDTDIEVNTPGGDRIAGHVVLDGATQSGTVRLRGGTGTFQTLSADLVVTLVESPIYSWDGTFTLGR